MFIAKGVTYSVGVAFLRYEAAILVAIDGLHRRTFESVRILGADCRELSESEFLSKKTQRFTFGEFTAVCQKNRDKVKQAPIQVLWTYKSRGIVTQDGDTYIISDAFCKKHGIV